MPAQNGIRWIMFGENISFESWDNFENEQLFKRNELRNKMQLLRQYHYALKHSGPPGPDRFTA